MPAAPVQLMFKNTTCVGHVQTDAMELLAAFTTRVSLGVIAARLDRKHRVG
jgi:hypothetical protein